MKKKHQDYTEEELRQERQYGLFWYSWLWHLLRPLLIALCVVLVVAGVVMTGYNWIDRHFFAPMDAQDQTPVSFTVASGSSLTKVANNLEAQGLIHNRTVFKYYADFLGYGQKIQAGDYQVSRAMRMQDIMELLTTGDGNPITRTITIIPGWTIQDI
ncbi:MAG: endolytic transglycosylase MltG, partial [Eubacteriales bacterium]|nr:endolytic transglycosylase MltG [Eubacteriales bacterium]